MSRKFGAKWRRQSHIHIEIDPTICGRKPVIRRTRILVPSVLIRLAAGEPFEKICRGFPGLGDEDIRTSVEFFKKG